MTKGPDFLHSIIEKAYAAALVSPAAVRALERQVRQDWGGERVYIAKAAPTDRAESPTTNAAARGGTSVPAR
jgi:hypothetical protein